jgi:hypothetical protein
MMRSVCHRSSSDGSTLSRLTYRRLGVHTKCAPRIAVALGHEATRSWSAPGRLVRRALSLGPIPPGEWPGGETGGMAFGQQAGPPASRREVQELLTLLQDAGHTDFRDARGPMGFTQRQAAGKFTRDEAAAFIAQLQESESSGELAAPRPPPGVGRRAGAAAHAGRAAGSRAATPRLGRRPALIADTRPTGRVCW